MLITLIVEQTLLSPYCCKDKFYTEVCTLMFFKTIENWKKCVKAYFLFTLKTLTVCVYVNFMQIMQFYFVKFQ